MKWDWEALGGISAAIAALLSFVAVLISLFTTWYQISFNKKAMVPILIPELKIFSADIQDVIFDWDTNEKLDKKFSKSTIELKNIGKESAVDIKYSFRIENEAELKKYLLNSNEPMGTVDSISSQISDDELLGKVTKVSRTDSDGEKYNRTYFMSAYVRNGKSISANSSEILYLPSYFVAIVNHNYMKKSGYLGELQTVMPVLRLKINFKDIYLKEWSVVYLLSMSRTYDLKNNSKLTTSVEYKQINKMKRIRSNWVKYVTLLVIVIVYDFLY